MMNRRALTAQEVACQIMALGALKDPKEKWSQKKEDASTIDILREVAAGNIDMSWQDGTIYFARGEESKKTGERYAPPIDRIIVEILAKIGRGGISESSLNACVNGMIDQSGGCPVAALRAFQAGKFSIHRTKQLRAGDEYAVEAAQKPAQRTAASLGTAKVVKLERRG